MERCDETGVAMIPTARCVKCGQEYPLSDVLITETMVGDPDAGIEQIPDRGGAIMAIQDH